MSSASHESSTNYIAKGFFFALGFTPVLLLLLALASWAGYRFMTQQRNAEHQHAVANSSSVHLQKQNVQQHRVDVINELRQIAEINEASQLSDLEKQEQNCNLAILRYSQTNSVEDKRQVSDLCPKK